LKNINDCNEYKIYGYRDLKICVQNKLAYNNFLKIKLKSKIPIIGSIFDIDGITLNE
jgi:hypothetical protein